MASAAVRQTLHSPWARRLRSGGLTLVEILVAMLILTLVLASAGQAISGWLRTSQRQAELLKAQLCADNALNEMRLRLQLPKLGSNTQTCVQAGAELELRTLVSSTPNPSILRIDIQVYAQHLAVLRLTTTLGRN